MTIQKPINLQYKQHQLTLFPNNRINGLHQEVDIRNMTPKELYNKIASTTKLLEQQGFVHYPYSKIEKNNKSN